MSKLKWDQTGERKYELGVDHGVLYRHTKSGTTVSQYAAGYAWNGLTAVNVSHDGGELGKNYADNINYFGITSLEEVSATIEAFTYPDEFAPCNGEAQLVAGVSIGQQNREEFGFCWRSKVGNDQDGYDASYKLHILYGCHAAPSDEDYETINDSVEAMTFSWDVSTVPVAVAGFKPTAYLEIDSAAVDADKLAALEAILYGTDAEGTNTATVARLPLPDEIKTILT